MVRYTDFVLFILALSVVLFLFHAPLIGNVLLNPIPFNASDSSSTYNRNTTKLYLPMLPTNCSDPLIYMQSNIPGVSDLVESSTRNSCTQPSVVSLILPALLGSIAVGAIASANGFSIVFIIPAIILYITINLFLSPMGFFLDTSTHQFLWDANSKEWFLPIITILWNAFTILAAISFIRGGE